MFDSNALYSVEFDNGFKILGICVDRRDNWVGFHDTGRGHCIEGKLGSELPDGFVWQTQMDDDGVMVDTEKFTFRVLTLDDFKRYFPNIYGLPDFKNTQELHEWYRRKYADQGSDY